MANRNVITNNKRHIYSKGPLFKVQKDFDLSPTGQMASFYQGTDKQIVAEYIHDVYTLKKKVNDPWEDVFEIRSNIAGEQMKDAFLHDVFAVKEYNPYQDKIPVERLSAELQTLVPKIQAFIREYKETRISIETKSLTGAVLYYDEIVRQSLKVYLAPESRIDFIIMVNFGFIGIWCKEEPLAQKFYDVLSKSNDGWTFRRKCVYHNSSDFSADFFDEEFLRKIAGEVGA